MRDKILLNLIDKKIWDEYLKIKYISVNELRPVKKQYKISICTNCMNRLEDLKNTYIQNIEDNLDYSNIEFVLLNYNSTDDIDNWVKENLTGYIERGIVNYYKTVEPKFYSMTHSRNVVFKLAQGDIVNNVDADHFTNKGFATYINLLANNAGKKVIFVKSKQKNRGRVGLFKKDFLKLGGYDEEIRDYGFDDEDLLYRANGLGFRAIKFTGQYFRIAPNHKRHKRGNYYNSDWRYTQKRNTLLSLFNIMEGRYVANRKREWGQAIVIKNFKEEIIL